MTTIANHATNRTARIDRRKLLVTFDDNETAICSSLSQATELALAHVATPAPTPVNRLPDCQLNRALLAAIARSTTWR
jgi:hypothetical protein